MTRNYTDREVHMEAVSASDWLAAKQPAGGLRSVRKGLRVWVVAS